jgi:hypothetical protein
MRNAMVDPLPVMPPAVLSEVQVDCERQLRQSRIDDQGISTVDHGSYQEAIVQRLSRSNVHANSWLCRSQSLIT